MRTSNNQLSAVGNLLNGFDYTNQAWVIKGVYMPCGHPEAGTAMPGRTDSFRDSDGRVRTMVIEPSIFEGCNCYGRLHAGEVCTTDGQGVEIPGLKEDLAATANA